VSIQSRMEESDLLMWSSTNSRKTAYLKTTCASCDAPLNNLEQVLNIKHPRIFCTRNQAADHLPLICDHPGCGLKFRDLEGLESHNYEFPSHLPLFCAIKGCGMRLQASWTFEHRREFHEGIQFRCAQCGLGFDDQESLDTHGSDAMHAAYVCEYPDCGSESIRIGDLNRHQLAHRNNVRRHPCPHCRR
jgi:general transcription factor IIIA